MTIEQSAKIYAIKYVLDLNSFKKNERMREDLTWTSIKHHNDKKFERLTEKYISEIRNRKETPMWVRILMAERYKIYL